MYYFSTVDNEKFCGGTQRLPHNITGKFWCSAPRNGSAILKWVLPLQSIRQTEMRCNHQPLRLTSTLYKRPIQIGSKILFYKNEHLKTFYDNDVDLYLLVMETP